MGSCRHLPFGNAASRLIHSLPPHWPETLPLANARAPRPDAACARARCLRLRPADCRQRRVRRSPHAAAGSHCHAHRHTYAGPYRNPNADSNPNAEGDANGRHRTVAHAQSHNRTPAGAETSPETDREALVALYNATGGPNWDSSDNWLSDVPIGEWFGVTTDDNGRVTELRLSENLLSGEIPAELGNLANLETLVLQVNRLSGEIPPELGNLANLQWLGLHWNRLSGEIPLELGNLANLYWLVLSENQIDWGDTAGVGQPRQPGMAGPQREPVER